MGSFDRAFRLRMIRAAGLFFWLGFGAAAPSAADTNASAIERGKYLATAGNCMTCHTTEGGEPFAGGRAFVTPFGTVYSTNITSDTNAGIGGWTQAQFGAALREGVRPNGEHLYPFFPYTAYTKMTDADVAALFAYIKTVKPVESSAPANELSFPYNQRWALGIWKAFFFEEGRFIPDRSQSEQWNRGKYLVDGLGHCSACHSPRNFLGAEKSAMAMTGGGLMHSIPNGELRVWAGTNLTAATTGLASWPLQEIASYLKTGRNAFVETFGPMDEVVLNSTRHLTEADTMAMATYLKSLPANEGDIGAPAAEDVLQEGSALYDVHCGTCHLPSGLGDIAEDAGPRLAGSSVVQASNPASLINVILYGAETALEPKRWKEMGAFEDKLSDEEVAALASFLRNAWGNKGGAVTSEQVAKQR